MKRKYSKDIPFLEALNQGFCDIEKGTRMPYNGQTVATRKVKEIHINWIDYADIRMYVKEFKEAKVGSFEKCRSGTAVFGTMWGAKVIVKKDIAQGKFVLVEEQL